MAFPKQSSRVTPNNTRPLSPVLFLPPHRSIFLQPRSSRHKLSNDSQMTAVGRLGDVGEPVTVEDRSQNTFTKMHPLRTRICRYQTSLAPTRHHHARRLAPRQPSLQATSRRIHKPSHPQAIAHRSSLINAAAHQNEHPIASNYHPNLSTISSPTQIPTERAPRPNSVANASLNGLATFPTVFR